MTIVTSGSDDVIEQITKHLNRLIEGGQGGRPRLKVRSPSAR